MDVIKQISETERSAQKCIADAQTKARDIISNAQRTAGQEYDMTLKQASAKAAQALTDAKNRGDDMAKQQLLEYRRQCDLLHKQAENRMGKAVAIVMERVVG